jgi:hypothetical protein
LIWRAWGQGLLALQGLALVLDQGLGWIALLDRRRELLDRGVEIELVTLEALDDPGPGSEVAGVDDDPLAVAGQGLGQIL